MKQLQKYKKNLAYTLFSVILLKNSLNIFFLFIFARHFFTPNDMLPDTLYDFSLICTMAVTTTIGLVLLCVGNAKVSRAYYLKRTKMFFAIIMLLIGCTAAVQWSLHLNQNNPLVESVLNITLVTTAFLLFYFTFFPLVTPIRLSTARKIIIFTTFTIYIFLLWASLTFPPTLSQIILFISIGLFFFELVRVNIIFFYNYKLLSDSHPEPGSEAEKRWSALNKSVTIFIVLGVSSALYVLFVVLIQQHKAIYQLAILFVWGYLFVKIINALIYLNRLSINDIDTQQTLNEEAKKGSTHNELSSKVSQWVERGGYRVTGITMKQAAQEMSTDIVNLSHYITKHHSCNFKSWIAQLRINYAKQLLATTSITIDMIAARAGFSNKAQFISAFKAHEGCTPGVWREQKQQ